MCIDGKNGSRHCCGSLTVFVSLQYWCVFTWVRVLKKQKSIDENSQQLLRLTILRGWQRRQKAHRFLGWTGAPIVCGLTTRSRLINPLTEERAGGWYYLRRMITHRSAFRRGIEELLVRPERQLRATLVAGRNLQCVLHNKCSAHRSCTENMPHHSFCQSCFALRHVLAWQLLRCAGKLSA